MTRPTTGVVSTLLALNIVAVLQAAPAHAAAPPSPAPAAAPVASTGVQSMIQEGKIRAEFRYRFESAEQAPFEKDAYASTLRSRLGLDSGSWHGLTATLEFDNVTVLGDDDAYNSTTNGVTDRPVVADPEYTEVNQAYLQYRQDGFTGVLGRQRITLDNQRFVGNVGWRQNEQTYDALTLRSTAFAKTTLQYSYIDNVNRVTGPDEGSQPANYHGAIHVLNGKVDLGTAGNVTGFGYLLDLENAPTLSSSTYGLHWAGGYKLSEATRLQWIASYATQSDYADNPGDYDADYWLLEGGATFGRFGIKAGYEVLGGDTQPNQAFQTPLATLHAFQGWADKFLTTPAGGVEDLYVGGSATFGAWSLNLVWHDFTAEATGADYGDEWNASAAYKFGKSYELLAKFADYSADGFATDTTKAWLQFSASF